MTHFLWLSAACSVNCKRTGHSQNLAADVHTRRSRSYATSARNVKGQSKQLPKQRQQNTLPFAHGAACFFRVCFHFVSRRGVWCDSYFRVAAGITFQLPRRRDVGPHSKIFCRVCLCLLVAVARLAGRWCFWRLCSWRWCFSLACSAPHSVPFRWGPTPKEKRAPTPKPAVTF